MIVTKRITIQDGFVWSVLIKYNPTVEGGKKTEKPQRKSNVKQIHLIKYVAF